MKLLATAVFAGVMAFGTAACAKEESKKETVVAAEVKKDAAAPATAKPETKKICVDLQGKDGKPIIDPKTKKPRQDCKTVTIRKKHEGTKPEDVKKK